jgi:hypothetical protein
MEKFQNSKTSPTPWVLDCVLVYLVHAAKTGLARNTTKIVDKQPVVPGWRVARSAMWAEGKGEVNGGVESLSSSKLY